ncbi:DUF7548 family protein [Halorussus halophilus]|uniref:DUF7548 family protein n=1 Tax=Halorussus halophilus TaxID=2650975 RepID=UPI001301429E|nr:hypothetical protein [Halorussus halophilus]
MTQELETRAPTLGIVAAVVVLAVVAVPYFYLSGPNVAVYYGSPTPVPVHLVVGLFAMVSVIVFAAGRNGRTDPPTAAGAAVVLGGFMAVLTLWWALAAGELVGSFPVEATFDYHRWLLLAATLLVAASGGWYANEVL